MVSVETFLLHYPRFVIVAVDTIQFNLEFASQTFVPASIWGIHREQGIMLATAHFLEMEWFQTAETTGTANATASGTGGKAPTSQQDDWLLTTWGRRFKFLRDGLRDGSISPVADEIFDGRQFGIGFPI